MSALTSQPMVAIVLCTYNGARHIQEQLDSLMAQTWPIAIRVFDDASSDNTIDLLHNYNNKLDITVTINSANLGYVANFESGIKQVLSEGFDYVALCDQDDIWHVDRIAKGMQAIQAAEKQSNAQTAVLAHSDLRMINADKETVHLSFLEYRRYEISNARSIPTVLGQNGVMGNTVLMNRTLATMAQPFPKDLHVHDYWLAVLAELHGQRILINDTLVDYRIHDTNASNSTGSIKFGAARLFDGKSWKGFVQRDYRLPFKEDERLNVIDALLNDSSKFPPLDDEKIHLLTLFRKYLVFKSSRINLLYSMLEAGFFRKGFQHRLRLAFSTLLTKRYD